ncbi:helix-turn-helix domain-containing protein, partial [Candidatus Poribacteria bacterium]
KVVPFPDIIRGTFVLTNISDSGMIPFCGGDSMENTEEWLSVKDVAKIRNCTDRTVLRMIEKKEVEAKRDGKRWLILKSSLSDDDIPTESDVVSILKVQLQEQKEETDYLKGQLEIVRQESEASRKRSDTIILQLTQQNQLMLEDKTTPWYRRWFRKRQDSGSETR